MTLTSEDIEELKQVASALTTALQNAQVGFPLNRRETMAGFILMGLTSRLMPNAVSKNADRQNIIKLGVTVADEALALLAETAPLSSASKL